MLTFFVLQGGCADADADVNDRFDAFVPADDARGPSSEGGGRWQYVVDGGSDGGSEAGDAGDVGDDAAVSLATVRGLRFEPLLTRDRDGQTVAHMELTGIVFLPEDDGLLVWGKTGHLFHYQLEDGVLVLQGRTQLDGVYAGSDCGLVGLAPDPDWTENHYLWVSHCVNATHGAVFRYQFDPTNYDGLRDTAALVIEVGEPDARRAWHNLGSVGFFDDAERSMWILSGEKTVAENAQDLGNDLGAVLRIVPERGEGTAGYRPHPDNPFASPGASADRMSGPNLYAWGLRSPWRGAIDRAGRIWIADVGDDIEEINLVRRAGQNFGWSTHEGPCTGDECGAFTDPVVSWDRDSNHRYRMDDADASPTSRRCASLGAHYELDEHDRYLGYLDDSALFSDMCLGYIRAVAVDGAGRTIRDQPVGHLVGLSSAAQGPDGYLYVTSFGSCTSSSSGVGSGIYRVVVRTDEDDGPVDTPSSTVPLTEDPLGPFPLKLSQTGAFSGSGLRTPQARMLPYAPTLPLWSNGSDKERFVLLPKGTRIDNSRRRSWDFPTGTLFFKTFSYEDSDGDWRRVETRVIRRTQDGYDYHAYKWKGADAELLSLERAVQVPVELADGSELTHAIPSEFDCRTCHESNRNVVIGFDELRLNGAAPDETQSQLAMLADAGIFEQAPPTDPDQVAAEDDRTRRVLGYLHGNCAHCHNGSANTMSALSLEHATALEQLIDVPTQGSGQAAGVRIVPGAPEQSVLFQAFSDEGRDPELQKMPPVGVQLRDAEMIELLRAWITEL